MAEEPVIRRLYGDKEIGELIGRATEIQNESKPTQEHGVSLRELEGIAAEIGIDPVHLRAAAMEMDGRGSPSRGARLLGGPFVHQETRMVEGELTEEQWERIVAEMRRFTNSEGYVSVVGRTREWRRAITDAGYVIEETGLTITPAEGQTRIELRKRAGGGARLAYLLSAIFGGTLAGIFLDGGSLPDLVNGAIVVGSGLAGTGAARGWLGVWMARQRALLARLTDHFQATIDAGDAIPTTGGVTSRPGIENPDTRRRDSSRELPSHLPANG